MEYSRAASTIAKAVLMACLAAPSFASEVSLGFENVVVHDRGFRAVYQRNSVVSVNLAGGYPLMYGVSIVGGAGYARSIEDKGHVWSQLHIANIDMGMAYRPPVHFIVQPYVSLRARVLFGWSEFSDGYTHLIEDAQALGAEASVGGEIIFMKKTWGSLGGFLDIGWLQARPLIFPDSGDVDISGISTRTGVYLIF